MTIELTPQTLLTVSGLLTAMLAIVGTFAKVVRWMDRQKKQDAESEMRRSQIGTGDRSEKIRTYNFPQGRVTDHRINLTLYKLDKIMNGDIQEIIDACIAADQAKKLANMNEN